LQQAVQAKLTAGNCNNSNAFSGAWKNIGPNESPEQVLGRIDAVWADPNDSTDVLAATYGGFLEVQKSMVTGNGPVLRIIPL
jgi:hypothetical protein